MIRNRSNFEIVAHWVEKILLSALSLLKILDEELSEHTARNMCDRFALGLWEIESRTEKDIK